MCGNISGFCLWHDGARISTALHALSFVGQGAAQVAARRETQQGGSVLEQPFTVSMYTRKERQVH